MTPLSFHLFDQFSDRVRIGMFGKDDDCTSDEECASKLGFDKVVKLYQVHGPIVHKADILEGIADGDGLVTDKRNTPMSIRWADCQGFVIYAPEKNALGVLHAGWKGMATKAITSFYEKLREEYNVKPEETYVGSTPSLCALCAEFSDPETELPEHLHPFIEKRNVDLQAAAEAEFDQLGVSEDHRERHPECTKCGSGFWSWRGDKREDRRNHLVAGLL